MFGACALPANEDGDDQTLDAASSDSARDSKRDTNVDDAKIEDSSQGASDVKTDTNTAMEAGADASTPDTSVADTSVADTSVADTSKPDVIVMDAAVDTSLPSTLITNTPNTSCSNWIGYGASAGNAGPYMAARLTPPSYPHVINSFSYDLVEYQNGPCTASLAHTVIAFRTTTVAPPSVPTVSTVQVSAAAPNLPVGVLTGLPATYSVRRVKIVFTSPVTLTTGEHLFIGIQSKSSGADFLCSLVCPSAPADSTRNYWSSTTSSPFSWVTLASGGTNANLRAWAE